MIDWITGPNISYWVRRAVVTPVDLQRSKRLDYMHGPRYIRSWIHNTGETAPDKAIVILERRVREIYGDDFEALLDEWAEAHLPGEGNCLVHFASTTPWECDINDKHWELYRPLWAEAGWWG